MKNQTYMSAPFGIVTAVTYKCNLKCKHCFAGSPEWASKPSDDMSTDEWKSLIHQLGDMGVHEIYFGGGEPFVRTDIMEIIAEARSVGIGTTLTTNGTLVKESQVKKLAELGVECIEVSIDGDEERHDYLRGVSGAYRKSLDTIRLLSQNNIYVIASVTLSKGNIKVVDQIISELKAVGIKEILFMRFIPCGIGRKFREQLYITEKEYRDAVAELIKKYEPEILADEMVSLNKEHSFYRKSQAAYDGYFYPHAGCIAGRTYCFLRPNGDITPCNPLSFEQFVAGNVREQRFSDIWNDSKVLQDFRDIELKDMPNCLDCQKIDTCVGGCRLMCKVYDEFCDNNCDDCSRVDSCNDASGMCGKKYMYYFKVSHE